MTFEEMFKDYMFTRSGVCVDISDIGFITYKQESPDTVYAIDLYTAPSERKQGKTLEQYQVFESKIKAEGFKYLITSVAFFDPNSTDMLTKMIKSGYKLFSSDQDLLYVRKEL